mgnify:CR=1 FL=1
MEEGEEGGGGEGRADVLGRAAPGGGGGAVDQEATDQGEEEGVGWGADGGKGGTVGLGLNKYRRSFNLSCSSLLACVCVRRFRRFRLSNRQKTKTKNKNNGPPSSPNSVHPWRLPSSKFRAVWETINFFLYLINAFVIPTRIVFGIRDNYVEPIYITIPAIIIQSVFFIDLVLRGFLFAHEKQGIVVAAPTRIFSDYIRTWLLWDLVGFFPFYFVGQIFLPRQTASLLLSFQMLKLVRYFDYWKFIVVYFTRKQVEVNMTVIEIR